MADLSLEDQNFVVRQTELIAELEENVFEGDVILEVRPAFRDEDHDEPQVGLTAIRAFGDNKHATQDGGIGVLGIGAKDNSGIGVKGIGKYRVVARRKDVPTERLPKFDVPSQIVKAFARQKAGNRKQAKKAK